MDYYVKIIGKLGRFGKDNKITLIAVLSSSILESEARKPKDRTQEMIDCCCGSWVGEQTAEEIISNINDSKPFYVKKG